MPKKPPVSATPEEPKTSLAQAQNEAEFQARILKQLCTALPLLKGDLRAERYLHLKLGHHEIEINGEAADKGKVKGRLDVVVYLNDIPLLLAELKGPEVVIKDEDADQGLSYARLHRPMVPLVLITNGSADSTRLLHAYDGTAVTHHDADATTLLHAVSTAAELAAAATRDAIRTLLGRDPVVWQSILGRWNTESIAARTGSIGDFRRPIAAEFSIPRTAVAEIVERLNSGNSIVVLHGPPLSGVTCTLVQVIAERKDAPCLYLDARHASDPLQFIANRLSRELDTGVSKDDLRQWLNTGQVLPNLTLIIDGPPVGSMSELVEMAEAGLFKIVFGLDSWTLASLSSTPGRGEETVLGRLAHTVELDNLSSDEFEAAQAILDEELNARFLQGAKYVSDLKIPRTLRLLASQLPKDEKPKMRTSASGVTERRIFALTSIPGPHILKKASAMFAADPRLKHDLAQLAKAFLEDLKQNGTESDTLVETFGVLSIDPTIVEATAGENRTERLLNQGILHWVDNQVLGPRVVVRLPELVSHYVSLEWAKDMRLAQSDEEVVSILHRILLESRFLPYGDLAIAAAIFSVEDAAKLQAIFTTLRELAPKPIRLREGSIVDILLKGQKIRLHFDEGMDEYSPGDVLPWVVLSHLASKQIEINNGLSLNAAIFAEIGNSEDLIYSPPPEALEDMVAFDFHEVEGVGSFPCSSIGIVEPLVQSMYGHALRAPEHFEELARYAIAEKKIYLAWRLNIVAATLVNSDSPLASAAAARATEKLTTWLSRIQKVASDTDAHG